MEETVQGQQPVEQANEQDNQQVSEATGDTQAPLAEGEVEHTITQEDLDTNPELAEQGVKVGDDVTLGPVVDPENLNQEQQNTNEAEQAEISKLEKAEETPVKTSESGTYIAPSKEGPYPAFEDLSQKKAE